MRKSTGGGIWHLNQKYATIHQWTIPHYGKILIGQTKKERQADFEWKGPSKATGKYSHVINGASIIRCMKIKKTIG